MVSWKSLIISFAIIGVFAYALLSFGGILQVQNNVTDTIFNNPALKPFNTSITLNLNDLKTSASNQSNASNSEQETLLNPNGALLLGSIFNSLTRFTPYLYGFGSAFLGLILYLIQDPLIEGVLFSMVIVIVIFGFWRMLKQGE